MAKLFAMESDNVSVLEEEPLLIDKVLSYTESNTETEQAVELKQSIEEQIKEDPDEEEEGPSEEDETSSTANSDQSTTGGSDFDQEALESFVELAIGCHRPIMQKLTSVRSELSCFAIESDMVKDIPNLDLLRRELYKVLLNYLNVVTCGLAYLDNTVKQLEQGYTLSLPESFFIEDIEIILNTDGEYIGGDLLRISKDRYNIYVTKPVKSSLVVSFNEYNCYVTGYLADIKKRDTSIQEKVELKRLFSTRYQFLSDKFYAVRKSVEEAISVIETVNLDKVGELVCALGDIKISLEAFSIAMRFCVDKEHN